MMTLEKGGVEIFGMLKMNNRKRENAQNKRDPKSRCLFPTRRAGNLWLIGLSILLLSILGVWVRWCTAVESGSVGFMLTAGEELEYLMAGLAILTGGALLLDYMERTENKK